jgi:very-short-patch-repair endonuclease
MREPAGPRTESPDLRTSAPGAGGTTPLWRLVGCMPQFPATHRVQAAIAAVAGRQHGVITVAQLHRCGLGPSGIRDWLRAGRLHRIHRGVYAVGHLGLSIEGEWLAAVLACGETAALSHVSAGMLWRMLEPRRANVHVTVTSKGGRARRDGVRIHRAPTLLPSQATRRLNIPVTKPARTLDDLRRTSPRVYRRALRQAEYLRLRIGDVAEADGTRSGLERRFLAFCRRHRLPTPETNVRLGPYTVDFLWPLERVVVETDSYRTHGGTAAFEEDRERDMWLKARGYEVVRVTDRRLDADPAGVATDLRAILRRAAAAYAG